MGGTLRCRVRMVSRMPRHGLCDETLFCAFIFCNAGTTHAFRFGCHYSLRCGCHYSVNKYFSEAWKLLNRAAKKPIVIN